VWEKVLFSAAAAQGGQTKETGSGTQERWATETPQLEQGQVGPGGEKAGSDRWGSWAATAVGRRKRQAEQKAAGWYWRTQEEQRRQKTPSWRTWWSGQASRPEAQRSPPQPREGAGAGAEGDGRKGGVIAATGGSRSRGKR
jgi:hypothetical protein